MNNLEQPLTPRKTLTLSKPLAPKTLAKIKVKRTPEGIKAQIKQDKTSKQKRIKGALEWLCQKYPQCFKVKDPKPLKIKIEVDVLKDRDAMMDQKKIPSKKSLRDAISYYAHNIKYLKSHLKYDHRINLQGERVSDDLVTPDQKEYATKHLADIKAKYATSKRKKPHRSKVNKKDTSAHGHQGKKQDKKTGKKQEQEIKTETREDSSLKSS